MGISKISAFNRGKEVNAQFGMCYRSVVPRLISPWFSSVQAVKATLKSLTSPFFVYSWWNQLLQRSMATEGIAPFYVKAWSPWFHGDKKEIKGDNIVAKLWHCALSGRTLLPQGSPSQGREHGSSLLVNIHVLFQMASTRYHVSNRYDTKSCVNGKCCPKQHQT